jgi:hypothetical protein
MQIMHPQMEERDFLLSSSVSAIQKRVDAQIHVSV